MARGEKLKANWLKILCVALSVALCAGIAAFAGVEIAERNKQKKQNELLSNELSPLLEEKSVLSNSLEAERSAYESALAGVATVQFIAGKPIAELYTDINGIIEEKAEACGLTSGSVDCVIGLSAANMPDSSGMLTGEQALGLYADGWSFCYFLSAEEEETFSGDKDTALSGWISETSAAAAALKIEIAPAICFGEDTYDYDTEALKELGFTFIGKYFADGSYCAEEKTGGVWINPTVGYCVDYAKRYFSQTVTKGANMALTFCGDSDDELADIEDGYEQLSKMFKNVFEYAAEGEVKITSSFSDMIAEQEKELDESACAEYEERIAALQEQIKEVNKKISDVYDKYN